MTTVFHPGEDGYEQAARSWNTNVEHRPDAVVMVTDADVVIDAVRRAARHDLPVGVMATGHGTAAPISGGILLNTSQLRDVRIDPSARTAVVAPGARWADVVPAAAKHGLAGLPGSSSQVGVVGYSLGGGFGWLGRRYGLASDSIRSAELVTAEGRLITVDETHELWDALRYSSGNFGVVTSLEFDLHPVAEVYGGNLFYPVERAREVLRAYAVWTRRMPDEFTSAVTFRRFPDLPVVPDHFRGRQLIAVRGAWCGDPAEGERLVDGIRTELGAPVVDTFTTMPVTELDTIGMDPVDPIGFYTHAELLRDLTGDTIEKLVALGAGAPVVALEIRQLGGALGRLQGKYSLNAIGATPTPESKPRIRSYLTTLEKQLRPFVTGGTYLNFLDLGTATPERIQAAYGAEDWARLRELKRKWDPANLFRLNRNIPVD